MEQNISEKILHSVSVEWQKRTASIVQYRKEGRHDLATITEAKLEGYLWATEAAASHIGDAELADDCFFLNCLVTLYDIPITPATTTNHPIGNEAADVSTIDGFRPGDPHPKNQYKSL